MRGWVALSRCLLRIPAHSKSTSIAIKHTFMQVCPEGMKTFIVFCCLISKHKSEQSDGFGLICFKNNISLVILRGNHILHEIICPIEKCSYLLFSFLLIAHFPQNRIVNLTLYCIAKYKPSSDELLCQTPATTLGWVHVPYLIHI